ncbi:MAG: PEP-CTERM sorting domain-containing protein [Acidobacteriota bacterium]
MIKIVRSLFLCLLVFGLTRASYAFKLGVLDAPPPTFEYTGAPLNITFSSCGAGSSSTDGCASIINDTGATITSLLVDVPARELAGQSAVSCLQAPGSLFSSCMVSEIDSNTEYQFDFTGGDIPFSTFSNCDTDDATFFQIEEQGVNYQSITADLTAPTPEPASIWLLASGMLLLAGFLYRRRLFCGAVGS